MKAYQIIKSHMNGSEALSFVYLDREAAARCAEKLEQEWIHYKVIEVECREISPTEGIVNRMLVDIRRDVAAEALVKRALKKLTEDEVAAVKEHFRAFMSDREKALDALALDLIACDTRNEIGRGPVVTLLVNAAEEARGMSFKE
jgi:hypothetical protein